MEKYTNQSLCSFLNSAMNIELVYLVIIGVNHFMELQEQCGNQVKKLNVEKHDETIRVSFKKVNFANPELWNVNNKDELNDTASVMSFD